MIKWVITNVIIEEKTYTHLKKKNMYIIYLNYLYIYIWFKQRTRIKKKKKCYKTSKTNRFVSNDFKPATSLILRPINLVL